MSVLTGLRKVLRVLVGYAVLCAASAPPGIAQIRCPIDQTVFAPSNPDFLGLVGNELMITVAYEANVAYLAQQYRAAGVKHARVLLSWEAIQPAGPDSFDWGHTDLLVDGLSNAGLRTLGIVAVTPNWASSCPWYGEPGHRDDHHATCIAADMQDYRDFVTALVQRYGSRIDDWEIRIENTAADVPYFTKENYVLELNAAYEVIKAADASDLVWAPEVAFLTSPEQHSRAYNWIDHVIGYGNFDVLSIHQFGSLESAWISTNEICRWIDCRNLLFGRPLAVTAMNFYVDNPASYTGAQQAANLKDLYSCMSAAGASYAMWFSGTQWANQNAENPTPIPCDRVYGIFQYTDLANETHCNPTLGNPNRLVPRQAYGALQSLGSAMGPLPQPEPYGFMGVSGNPCDPGASDSCSVRLYWYSTELTRPYVQLRRAGLVARCSLSNRASSVTITLVPGEARTFTMYPANDCASTPTDPPLATLTVNALPN